jgi:hypothetical protein
MCGLRMVHWTDKEPRIILESDTPLRLDKTQARSCMAAEGATQREKINGLGPLLWKLALKLA